MIEDNGQVKQWSLVNATNGQVIAKNVSLTDWEKSSKNYAYALNGLALRFI